MTNAGRLLIMGCGGHARSVADVAWATGVRNIIFIDENARPGEKIMGFDVLAYIDTRAYGGWQGISGSGDNDKRKQHLDWLRDQGLIIANIIAPSATVGIGASIAAGVFIGHHAHVGPQAVLCDGVIINTAALVEHESVIAEFTHISVNSTVAGRCKVGAYSFLGAAAVLIDGIAIAERVTVGAGGCVVRSIEQAGTYIGVPARMAPGGQPE